MLGILLDLEGLSLRSFKKVAMQSEGAEQTISFCSVPPMVRFRLMDQRKFISAHTVQSSLAVGKVACRERPS